MEKNILNIILVIVATSSTIYYDVVAYTKFRHSNLNIILSYLASFIITTSWLIIFRTNNEANILTLAIVSYVIGITAMAICPIIIIGEILTTMQKIGLLIVIIGGIMVTKG